MHVLSKTGLRWISLVAIVLALVAGSWVWADDATAQASQTLEAQIANVVLKIDGQVVQNLRSKYPVLFYKDITYFPVTYNYTQALGLQSDFEASKGLSVTTNPKGAQKLIQDLLNDDEADQIPGKVVVATVPAFPITVQGKQVKAQSEWPFLLYNEITYMPATWEYMVTNMGLKLEYEIESRTLSLGGYVTPGNKVALSDISALPKVFATEYASEQKVGMSAKVTVSTTGYGQLNTAKLKFDYDGIVDSASKQLLYTLTPDAATASLLSLDSVQMYARADAKDANRMQLFTKEGSAWKRSNATTALTPDLFVSKPLNKEEALKTADNLDAMGLGALASVLRNPNASQIYGLYKNFTLEKTASTATLKYDGTLKNLLADFGIAEGSTNMSKFYGYVLSMDNLTGSAVSNQGAQISAMLQFSTLKLTSVYDIATGQLQSQSLELGLMVSASDAVADISMDISYNYNPVLSWPTVE